MSTEVIEKLHKCRIELQELSTSLDIENYRDELCKEYNVAVDLLDELKEAQKREAELDQKCIAVQNLSNKMSYVCNEEQISVTKNKIKDLSNQINHAIRNHEVVVNNKKRVEIEIDRLDDILRITQLELSEYGDTPSLIAETQGFVPLPVAREQALIKMKNTTQKTKNTTQSLQREKLQHRELVYDLKTEIKKTRADIEAMENGTFAPDVEFMSRLAKRRADQTSELERKRKAIEDEIEELQSLMAKDDKVHIDNVSALQSEKVELEQNLADTAKDNATDKKELETTLDKLKVEQSEHDAVLQQLETRLEAEKEERRLLQE